VRSGNRPGGGSAGSNDDGRLAGDSSCGEVAAGVGNVFEVDGSIDDGHDGAAGEVLAEAFEDCVVLLVDRSRRGAAWRADTSASSPRPKSE